MQSVLPRQDGDDMYLRGYVVRADMERSYSEDRMMSMYGSASRMGRGSYRVTLTIEVDPYNSPEAMQMVPTGTMIELRDCEDMPMRLRETNMEFYNRTSKEQQAKEYIGKIDSEVRAAMFQPVKFESLKPKPPEKPATTSPPTIALDLDDDPYGKKNGAKK